MASYDTSSEFGDLYDAIPIYADRTVDVRFYVAEAERAGPRTPVLELGCGTGRISLPVARAGHPLTGVDSSASMLERFRAKLAAESPDVRARVALREGDVRDVALSSAEQSSGFPLVIAPFRVMQHMTTIPDQLRMLATVRHHLAPGGHFAFDAFNPSFSRMIEDRSAEAEDTPELTLPDGRTMRRTVRVTAVHWVAQVMDVELIYYLRTGADVERIVQAFEMRWFTASELEHLLARAGFRVEGMYGDFDRGALTDASPELLVVATRAD